MVNIMDVQEVAVIDISTEFLFAYFVEFLIPPRINS